MTAMLNEMLAAGFIEKLDGNDDRFAKMERAAEAVAGELRKHPPGLIRAILAGLDPDVPPTDPAIVQAERALVAEWKSMSSVYPSPPVGLFRAILLDACEQAAEGNNAAILWFTAADTFPLLHLGREEHAVMGMLEGLASLTEEVALSVPSIEAPAQQAPQVAFAVAPASEVQSKTHKVDRKGLLLRVAASAGPQFQNNQAPLTNPNPFWPAQHQAHQWSWEFAERMHVLLADELDALAVTIGKAQAETNRQVQTAQSELANRLKDAWASQQQWVQSVLRADAGRRQTEHLRLDALWWSEALYSHSLQRSYRELPPQLAAVVMAIDLLSYMPKSTPSPASVGYLLAEALHRLPDAGFDRTRKLSEILGMLHETRGRLPEGWPSTLVPAPQAGRLSLRDLVRLSLGENTWSTEGALARAGLSGDADVSLPALSHALFRQEQAARLAGGVA